MHRRAFITGLVGLIAAPAIVRASSLMPVRGIVTPINLTATEVKARADYVFQRYVGGFVWVDAELTLIGPKLQKRVRLY